MESPYNEPLHNITFPYTEILQLNPVRYIETPLFLKIQLAIIIYSLFLAGDLQNINTCYIRLIIFPGISASHHEFIIHHNLSLTYTWKLILAKWVQYLEFLLHYFKST